MKLDITSDVYPGSVELPDKFGWPDMLAYHAMLRVVLDSDAPSEEKVYLMLPGLIKIVRQWNIKDWPEKPAKSDDIPCVPLGAVMGVVTQIFTAIRDQARGEDTVPLAFPPKPTRRQRAKTSAKS
jgi:hypothetical protein